MISHFLATGLGGALGAMTRLGLSKILPATLYGLPLPMLIINVLGCFIMGLLTEAMALYWSPIGNARYFLIPGFLGGFTTFAAFSLEFGLLIEKNQFLLAMLYLVLQVFLSLMFFFVGMKSIKVF